MVFELLQKVFAMDTDVLYEDMLTQLREGNWNTAKQVAEQLIKLMDADELPPMAFRSQGHRIGQLTVVVKCREILKIVTTKIQTLPDNSN